MVSDVVTLTDKPPQISIHNVQDTPQLIINSHKIDKLVAEWEQSARDEVSNPDEVGDYMQNETHFTV